jgi:hypothetical protein
MCDFELQWTRSDHSPTTPKKLRAHANASLVFKGCTAQGTVGEECKTKYKIASGVNKLVNMADGKGGQTAVGYGTCCNTQDAVVRATRSNCH